MVPPQRMGGMSEGGKAAARQQERGGEESYCEGAGLGCWGWGLFPSGHGNETF